MADKRCETQNLIGKHQTKNAKNHQILKISVTVLKKYFFIPNYLNNKFLSLLLASISALLMGLRKAKPCLGCSK